MLVLNLVLFHPRPRASFKLYISTPNRMKYFSHANNIAIWYRMIASEEDRRIARWHQRPGIT